MAELRPYPFPLLIERMFGELAAQDKIFDLPRRRFVCGDPARDTSVVFHGRRAATPFGPAAGPQSQLAQNIVLSFLVGGRIIELKTVQIKDELEIPRPCIDMQTIGFNVEWSQELKLEQSAREYVKASMLIEMLRQSGLLGFSAPFGAVIYDMSVGYDLAGITSPPVRRFLDTMLDASALIEEYRAKIPRQFRRYADLDFAARISNTLTLSTFHGCPPDEIERIVDFLLREYDLHCIIKLNPTLLGPERMKELLHDKLGYDELRVPTSAFDNDTKWDQAVDFVGRLGETAAQRGLGFGVKFTNTLIVENHRDFFPGSEREMYMSGPPLHVLAISLVEQFRERFADQYTVSFSAGIDRKNFADAVACGLTPVTACSDLLKPSGYARAHGYFDELYRRMKDVGARDIDTFVLLCHGQGRQTVDEIVDDPQLQQQWLAALTEPGAHPRDVIGAQRFDQWVAATKQRNSALYAAEARDDARYHRAQNSKPPKKIGSRLVLLDCISCDKCVPVCPNDANFTFVLPRGPIDVLKARCEDGHWLLSTAEPLEVKQAHQIGNFADFCNECGNCDIFCPEDGGPYAIKPRFFGSLADFETFTSHDGFVFATRDGLLVLCGRFSGNDYRVELRAPTEHRYVGQGFDVTFDPAQIERTIAGHAEDEVDLTYHTLLVAIHRAVVAAPTQNYVALLAK
ncbi:MAG: glutamate synthase [Deltaproteobacteria bacterium]|nr:glutamate synthase [Deltaproteobacteria bacterium]